MTAVTISGTPGSGKSTVSKLLNKKLNLKYVNSGMIFREMAEEHNMSLEKFGKYCEKNSEVDKQLDKRQIEILKQDDVILEGRLSGWMAYKNNIPAFKVMIDADVNIRARRVVKREGGSAEEKKKKILQREGSEKLRYKQYYDIDITDTSIYNLVIDSGDKTPEEIVDLIVDKIDQ